MNIIDKSPSDQCRIILQKINLMYIYSWCVNIYTLIYYSFLWLCDHHYFFVIYLI